MKGDRLRGILGDAVRLNVRYYAALFDATSDYVKALRTLVDSPDGGGADRTGAPEAPGAETATPAPAPASPVPPLVLAARAGEMAEARFAVTNSTPRETAADIEISAELREAGVTAEPAGMMMSPGQQVVFRLVGQPGKSMPVGTDMHGTVSVPGLGNRTIPVVLRRLEDAPATAAAPEKKKAGAAAKAAPKAAKASAAAGTQRTKPATRPAAKRPRTSRAPVKPKAPEGRK